MNINDLLLYTPTPVEDHDAKVKRMLEVLGKKCSWSIIYALMKSRSGMLNITALVNMVGSNYNAVSSCIEDLEEVGIIEVLKLGRLKIVKLNERNPVVQAMKNLLMVVMNSTSF